MTAAPKQPHLPGIPVPTPPDDRHADLEGILTTLHEAEKDRNAAAERVRDSKDAMLAKMAELGYERYAFDDPRNGKRRHFVRDTTARAKVMGAPKKLDLYDDDAAIEDVDAGEGESADDGKVEVRKVSRASVAHEIDPFAGVRDRMPGGVQ
jgi:hypothetical protein